MKSKKFQSHLEFLLVFPTFLMLNSCGKTADKADIDRFIRAVDQIATVKASVLSKTTISKLEAVDIGGVIRVGANASELSRGVDQSLADLLTPCNITNTGDKVELLKSEIKGFNCPIEVTASGSYTQTGRDYSYSSNITLTTNNEQTLSKSDQFITKGRVKSMRSSLEMVAVSSTLSVNFEISASTNDIGEFNFYGSGKLEIQKNNGKYEGVLSAEIRMDGRSLRYEQEYGADGQSKIRIDGTLLNASQVTQLNNGIRIRYGN